MPSAALPVRGVAAASLSETPEARTQQTAPSSALTTGETALGDPEAGLGWAESREVFRWARGLGGCAPSSAYCGAQWRKWAGGGRWGEAEDSRTLTAGLLCRGTPRGRGGERSPRESAIRRGPEEAKSEVIPGRTGGAMGVTVAGSGESRRIMGGPEVVCHGEGGSGLEHSL